MLPFRSAFINLHVEEIKSVNLAGKEICRSVFVELVAIQRSFLNLPFARSSFWN